MKSFSKIMLYYAWIPFLVSLPVLVLNLSGAPAATVYLVPVLAAAVYGLFRKKLDMHFAARINGTVAVVLLVCFTVMMAAASGNAEGTLMANFCWLIFPFAPIMLFCMLMGKNMLLYTAAILTYTAAWAISAQLGKVRMKKSWMAFALAVICIITSSVLYCRRPSVKYGGHGFQYMHGYSSTDFSDFMVYSPDSRLAVPDRAVSLRIEREADMPVLDGAEACYPLYAAFAKAVYKDIDKIEMQWQKETDDPSCNGKIVTFTNTVSGFMRLLRGAKGQEKYGGTVDMFFGARPSAMQMFEAEESGVVLTITPIAREAFVFFVESDNPVDDLTEEQLRAIYHGSITNWSELGGDQREILAFQRPKNSGSQTMMESFMGELPLREPKTYEKVDAMMGVIHQVAQYSNESGAIGYSFRYFLEELNQETGVKMLSINGVYPSLENIENGTYPLVTDVCLITREEETNPFVQKMKDFILSDEGQDIIRKTGYASLACDTIP